MIVKLYSIYDAVTCEYDKFFVARNDDDAKRLALSSFSNHPFIADFSLYYTGVPIDTATGECAPTQFKREFLCTLKELFAHE